MAKKKKGQESASIKSIEEMTDAEFITYADYLSSPYYRAYITSHCRYYPEENEAQGRVYANSVRPVQKSDSRKKSKKEKLYVKKRSAALVVIALFMLLMLAASILGFLNIESISQYLSIYNVPKGIDSETGKRADISVSVVDPIISVVKLTGIDIDIDSAYYELFIENNFADAATLMKIAALMVPIAAIVTVIFALIGFIKAIVALGSGANGDGFYKKYKFGYLSVSVFFSGLIFFFGGLYMSGLKLADAADFLFFKSDVMQAGYVLYAAVIVPIITFICSCAAYKKIK